MFGLRTLPSADLWNFGINGLQTPWRLRKNCAYDISETVVQPTSKFTRTAQTLKCMAVCRKSLEKTDASLPLHFGAALVSPTLNGVHDVLGPP